MKGPRELFRKLEREVRTPREKLPIDAFLPSPDSLPTEFPEPPPSSVAVQVRELGASAEEQRDRRERRRRQIQARKVAAKGKPSGAPKNIEEEINEFINRDKAEGVQEEDLSDFLGGFDPTEIPEK